VIFKTDTFNRSASRPAKLTRQREELKLSQSCHGAVRNAWNRMGIVGTAMRRKPNAITLFEIARDRPGPLVASSNPAGATNSPYSVRVFASSGLSFLTFSNRPKSWVDGSSARSRRRSMHYRSKKSRRPRACRSPAARASRPARRCRIGHWDPLLTLVEIHGP